MIAEDAMCAFGRLEALRQRYYLALNDDTARKQI